MKIESKQKDKIAIVAVGYNRINSIKRLLDSLVSANYTEDDIPLVISIDCSGDEGLYKFVKEFCWPHGKKHVIIHEKRLGLKNHILSCGDLTEYFKGVIILEDDIFVSEYFYTYVTNVVNYYYDERRVGGVSLYQNEMYGTLPVYFYNDGTDCYLKQTPASWGECWTDRQWKLFREWFDKFNDDNFKQIDMPDYIKGWKKAWSKYYMAYLIETNRYFIFPYISHTTCFGDVGEHGASISTSGQAELLCGPRKYCFKPYDDMVKYDIYCVNEYIYKWLGIEKKDLCVDWYYDNDNSRKARYLLTTKELPYTKVKMFGLQMRPIELNIKYTIPGNSIFLYDTIKGAANAKSGSVPISYASYHLRSFNIELAFRFSIKRMIRVYSQIIKQKIFK